MTDAPRVAVVGGGPAGLTAALRLAERGYRVTVYEQKPWLGGNLGAGTPGSAKTARTPGTPGAAGTAGTADGGPLDVYPHMFCNWYGNFWRLCADAGVRDERFTAGERYWQLARGEFPRFTAVTDMYSPWHVLQNVFSGVGPPADMWVFGYASLDLLAERLQCTMRWRDLSVAGFLNARPYMTTRAAAAFDAFITRVWAIPSYLASAEDFRLYLQYALADPTPPYWLTRGPAQREIIDPVAAALARHGVTVNLSVQMTEADCGGGRVREIMLRRRQPNGRWDGRAWREQVDELILAVPPLALVKLVRSGAEGRRMIDAAPQLAELSRLRSVPVPIINLFFTRRLRSIPAEPVGLLESPASLAFTDISQIWEGVDGFADRTVLAVSASDLHALPGTCDDDDAHAMLVELARYLEFDPGSAWGRSPDIDWTRTTYQPNRDAQLFVNEIGSDEVRPPAAIRQLANVALAGDFCQNDVGLTTVESAVTSGLHAVQAIVARRGLGDPPRVSTPRVTLCDELGWVWGRYALAPSTAAASLASRSGDAVRCLARALARQRRDSSRT